MKEVFGNLWDFDGIPCILTNGTARPIDGFAIMGAGVALEAKERMPSLPKLLGANLRFLGNHVFLFPPSAQSGYHSVITFPTKHNWQDRKADLALITQSTQELLTIQASMGSPRINLPRPGCGKGKLTWAEVKPIVSVLPDNIYIVGWPNEKAS